MKATITNVITDTKINTTYVTYSTGTEKLYPADKLPKTVQAWIEKNERDIAQDEQENAQNEQEVAQTEQEVAQTEQEVAQELDHETVQAVEEPELSVPLLEATPEPEPTPEPHQTHTEPRRAAQKKQVKTLSLDIVEGLVSALLMLSRVSLMALAYLLTGMAAAIRAGVTAYEWLTPRTAALIEQATAAYHTTVRPACKAALVWTAEAVWYILI